MYGSDPSEYDFAAALNAAGEAKPRTVTYGYGYPTKGKPAGRIVTERPTLERLKRHATRYGIDRVAETAREAGLSEGDLLELGVEGTTRERVAVLSSQGLVPAKIAKRLRLTMPTVRRHMATVANKTKQAA